MSKPSRDDLVKHSRLCLQLSRYDDASDCIKKVVKMIRFLNYEELTLLDEILVAKIADLLKTLRSMENLSEDNLINELRAKIKAEINGLVDENIKLLDSDVLHRSINVKDVVYIRSFKAFQYDIKIDLNCGENTNEDIMKARKFHEEAMSTAKKILKASHSLTICHAKRFSEFCKNQDGVKKALSIAQKAYDEGISNMQCVDNSLHEEAFVELNQLRGCIENWSVN